MTRLVIGLCDSCITRGELASLKSRTPDQIGRLSWFAWSQMAGFDERNSGDEGQNLRKSANFVVNSLTF